MLHYLIKGISAQRVLAASSRGFSQVKSSSAGTKSINTDVPGLSEKCVAVPKAPVGGPGAAKDKEYKNPEYFCYHIESFAEAEVELAKYRLPVPSNKKPFGT